MSQVAVIGSGLIGRAWAISFARAGHEVSLWSPTPGRCDEALRYVEQLLPDLAAHDLLNGLSVVEVRSNMQACASLSEAVSSAHHVQENAPENVVTKRQLFAELDALAPPDAVLASSTSDIPASLFTEGLEGRDRCVVAHPLNPPYLMPAVEVVPSKWTSPATVERTAEFMRSLGQSPIIMQREDLGFVTIRLQGALMQEAFRIVDSGLASADDVDRAIRDGLALRWSVIGPFETIDLNSPNGVREYVARYQSLYDRLARTHNQVVDWAGPVLEKIATSRRAALPLEQISQRQLWRDRQMMAVNASRRKV